MADADKKKAGKAALLAKMSRGKATAAGASLASMGVVAPPVSSLTADDLLAGIMTAPAGWDNGEADATPEASTSVAAPLRPRARIRVGELGAAALAEDGEERQEEDLTQEEYNRRREIDEARKLIAKSRKRAEKAARKAAEAAASGAAAAPAPAAQPAATLSWAEARRREREGWTTVGKTNVTGVTSDGKSLKMDDSAAFPGLAAGGHRGPKAVAYKAKKWVTAGAAADDAEEEEEEEEDVTSSEEEEEGAAGGAGAADPHGGLAVTGSKAPLVGVEAVRTETGYVVDEFLSSRDYGEALRRLTEVRCEPLSDRMHIVKRILEKGCEVDSMQDHTRLGKLLALLVPARVLSKPMLLAGVLEVMEDLRNLAMDLGPQTAKRLGLMCDLGGLAFGTLREDAAGPGTGSGATGAGAPLPTHDATVLRDKGYIPIEYIHKDVAQHIGKLSAAQLKTAGSQVKERGDEDEEEGGADN